MDIHYNEARNYNMSQIISENSKSEELVRKYLFSRGLRYKRDVKVLPKSPDIVLTKYKTVVFVNGCFWHIHKDSSKFI